MLCSVPRTPSGSQVKCRNLRRDGPAAQPAIPELLKIAYSWQTSARWSNAIPALASLTGTNGSAYALPWLLSMSTNQAASARGPPTIDLLHRASGLSYFGNKRRLGDYGIRCLFTGSGLVSGHGGGECLGPLHA
ncbi:hypothetical protein SBV1_330009 [Verrucomicrobia bacterium]|nr:hypothetical protein SBV1_330009 [Verrucomicrobiota bacterium]